MVKAFVSCFHASFDPEYVFSGEAHDFWELVYVVDGSLGVTAGERVLELSQGQLIFHKPLEFHRLWSMKGSVPSVIIMSFDAEGEQMKKFENGVFSLTVGEAAYLLKIMETIGDPSYGILEKEFAEPELIFQKMKCLLELFLLSLLSRDSAPGRFSEERGAAVYRKSIQFMQENISEKLTLQQLAAHAHVSVSSLKKVFQKFAGEGAVRYFTRLKVNEAKYLLEQGLPVSETGERLGFSSQNYFCTIFKKQEGISPSEYVKRFRARN